MGASGGEQFLNLSNMMQWASREETPYAIAAGVLGQEEEGLGVLGGDVLEREECTDERQWSRDEGENYGRIDRTANEEEEEKILGMRASHGIPDRRLGYSVREELGGVLSEGPRVDKNRSREEERSISRLNVVDAAGSRYLDDLIEEGEDVINYKEN